MLKSKVDASCETAVGVQRAAFGQLGAAPFWLLFVIIELAKLL
ncbi:hypothetical protein [Paenibacillus elgii]